MGCVYRIKRETGESPVRSRRRKAGLAISYATGKLGRRNRALLLSRKTCPCWKHRKLHADGGCCLCGMLNGFIGVA